MSIRFLDQQELRHHHRVHSAPDVPFSWERSPGVSKQQHDQSSSNSRRHGREKLRDFLQDHHHLHHQESSGTYLDDHDVSPHYLDHENNRRAIQKPPLRPPPCFITSNPRVPSSRSEHLATRGTPRTSSKLGGRKGGGGADDPFLAAYVKCTTPQKAAAKRKSSGFGFSCKSSVASGIRDDALVSIPRPS